MKKIETLNFLAYILKVDEREFSEIINDIDKYYYKKTEIKRNKDGTPKMGKDGTPAIRIIYPSIDRLKEIQERIHKNILQKLIIPNYLYGAIKGKDNIQNAKKHQGKSNKFVTDLKNFFPSITHHQVNKMFCRYQFSPTVAHILTKLTTYKGMLPQGTPTAPMIANLVFTHTGDKLANYAKMHGLTFTTFIDDLTFSSPKNFKEHTKEILAIIKADGFKISYDKTNYKTANINITGAEVGNNSLKPTEAFTEKLRNSHLLKDETIKGMLEYKRKIERSNKKPKQ